MFVLFRTIPAVYAQTGTDAKNLYTFLFTTNAYNKNVRPLADQTQAVTIETEFTLNSKYQHILSMVKNTIANWIEWYHETFA